MSDHKQNQQQEHTYTHTHTKKKNKCEEETNIHAHKKWHKSKHPKPFGVACHTWPKRQGGKKRGFTLSSFIPSHSIKGHSGAHIPAA